MMLTISHAAMGCTFASILLLIISISLPYWYYYTSGYFGLWKACSNVGGFSSCYSFAEVPAFLGATRAFVVIGLLLLAGSGVVGFLKLFVMKEKAMFPLIAGGLAIAAGISIILGVSIFGGKADEVLYSQGTLHAGFGIAVLSGLSALAAGGLYFVGKFYQTSTEQKPPA